MKQAETGDSPTGVAARLAPALVAAVAWAVLLGDDPASWVIGIPCVALCAWFGRIAPTTQHAGLSPLGLLQLLPYFLTRSIAGGWDVARRVLSPRLAVDPGFINFRLSLPEGPPRTFFVQFIGLLPGTLGAWVDGDCLEVHVLHPDSDHEGALREAEQRVASVFAVEPDH